ncbi:formin-like protein 18 isoform X2 [Syzygium oleosum]|uniref:formin-like protein 18 isoform X2 n=1 Tax=Syzygium oleosum TaxID=219896 RepID=UPI0024B98951|nr:formin-like protein 18 isoform X2 [Syzygium oleosum]
MGLFRKFFYKKPPEGFLEISERVYVFDYCFTTDVLEEDEYKVYIGGVVGQLRDHIPDASFMVFNFREGENQSHIANLLSKYDMTVMDYPQHYEGCPILTMEMIHHFLRSSESWLLLGQQNVLLMHCERGGWPVLAFMLAALLIYRKQYIGEHKTLDMVYKQAPRELLQLMSPLNPLPSQLRYLQYVSRRNVGSEWPPLDRALTLDCIILRLIPTLDAEGGCRPIFRIYGQDPFMVADKTPKVLFSTPKRSKLVRHYKQADCELVKIDIHCHIQGDVVLECISLDDGLEREEMMFRVMFNTAFIRANILMLNRDEIDVLWNSKDQYPKDFRAEILFSDMDAASSLIPVELPINEEKEGLPVEAFAKVQEIFSSVDWTDPKADVALNVLHQIQATSVVSEKLKSGGAQYDVTNLLLDLSLVKDSEKQKEPEDRSGDEAPVKHSTPPLKPSQDDSTTIKKMEAQEGQALKQKSIFSLEPPQDAGLSVQKVEVKEPQVSAQRPDPAKLISQRLPRTSLSAPILNANSLQGLSVPVSRYHSAPSALGITALLQDHAASNSDEFIDPLTKSYIPAISSPMLNISRPMQSRTVLNPPLPQPLLVLPQRPPLSSNSVGPHTAVDKLSQNAQLATESDDSLLSETFGPTLSPLDDNALEQGGRSSISSHLSPQSSLSGPFDFPATKISSPLPPLAPASPSLVESLSNVAESLSPNTSSPTHVTSTVAASIGNNSSPSPPLPASEVSASAASLISRVPSTKRLAVVSKPRPPPPPPHPHAALDFGTAAPVPPAPAPAPPPLCTEPASGFVIAPPPPPPPPLPPSSYPVSGFVTTPPAPPPPPSPSPPLPSYSGRALASMAAPPVPPPPPPQSAPLPGFMVTPPAPPPPPPRSGLLPGSTVTAPAAPPPPPPGCGPVSGSISTPSAPLPPPPPGLTQRTSISKNSATIPPPPPLAPLGKELSKANSVSPNSLTGGNNGSVPPTPNPPTAPLNPKGRILSRSGLRNQVQQKKANLKPYHWLKLTRAMQGSLWAEAQKSDDSLKAPEFDMSELESLFSAASTSGSTRGKSSRASGRKSDKIQLVDLRRAYNCEIMLTKVKVPLPDLMGYNGDKENLGKCEQFFLELLKVPRVESKLRVFSFKIQFHSQVSDLSSSLNVVNAASEEIRNSVKLKRIMQTILSLGNALNQGTARGSAIGFRLDSLLKLTDTRAKNNKITLMHYLCKVLAEKLPEVIDFHKDLMHLEASTKVQLKFLAEEMQAISKGLEKVVQELAASENDGPISENFCENLKEFLGIAEAEVRSLASLYSSVGRSADALALYFGEDPARCPFEQVVSTLLNFVRMFIRAHDENCKQLELEKKKMQKEAETPKMKMGALQAA